MGTRIDWSTDENLALCLAYCIMRQAQQRDETFNKSAIRRELIGTDDTPGPLYRRSNGSVEAKLMNVSAVAAFYGHELVKGYKPAPNYQAALRSAYTAAQRMVDDDTLHDIKTDISVAL